MNIPETIDLEGWHLKSEQKNLKVYIKNNTEKHLQYFDDYYVETPYVNGKKQGNLIGRTKQPFTDIPRKNSCIYLIEPYDQGMLSGLAQQFYDDDTCMMSRYQNNKLHGHREVKLANGQLIRQDFYQKGKKEGKQLAWHHNGKLKLEEYYNKGVQEGPCAIYDENGVLKLQRTYKNGQIDGLLYERWSSGEYSETYYKNQSPHGEEKVFYANGNLMRKGHYLKGKRHGHWVWYHNNGQKSITETYVADKLDGERLFFDDNGQLENTQVYKNDTRIA